MFIFLFPSNAEAQVARLPSSAGVILISATGTARKRKHGGPESLLFVSSLCGSPMSRSLLRRPSDSPMSVLISASFSIYLHLVVSILSFSVPVPLRVSEEHVPSHWWCFPALTVVPTRVIRSALSRDWVTDDLNRGKTPWHFNLNVSTSLGTHKTFTIDFKFQGRHTLALGGVFFVFQKTTNISRRCWHDAKLMKQEYIYVGWPTLKATFLLAIQAIVWCSCKQWLCLLYFSGSNQDVKRGVGWTRTISQNKQNVP